MGLLGHLIGLGSSVFDIVSDLLTGINFLSPGMFGTSEVPLDEMENENNKLWGIMTIGIIFLPGIIGGIPRILMDIWEREWSSAFWTLVFSMCFPIEVIVRHLMAVIVSLGMCKKKELDKKDQIGMFTLTAAEASFEAAPQLMLQVFTLLNGYQTLPIQILSIVSSYFMISRSIMLQDNDKRLLIKYNKSLSFFQSMWIQLKFAPLYAPNVMFRNVSFAISMTYLRSYAVIPITILLLELGYISWMRFRKIIMNDKERALMLIFHCMMINLVAFGWSAFEDENDEEEETKDTQRFACRSTYITAHLHCTVIVFIMIMGSVRPDFFIQTMLCTPASECFYTLS